ncbi:hypothetical protein [Streptomyces sp. NPDC047070]|uniref:hypothetical protein n=1 Tax=Streptomyces sp. NPDC047070 TaxID=3154923 RepID=UPI00345695AD
MTALVIGQRPAHQSYDSPADIPSGTSRGNRPNFRFSTGRSSRTSHSTTPYTAVTAFGLNARSKDLDATTPERALDTWFGQPA